jgi:AcrR family transcriptional regulator
MAESPSTRADDPAPSDPLLAAAHACIMDVGLRRTTLADVARRAGVSRMTVYRQYGDLQAIVSTLLTAELLALIDRCRSQVDDRPTARERLVEGAVLTIGSLVRHPLYRKVLDTDPELLLPLVVDRFGSTQRAAIELTAEQIAVGQREGSIREGDPQLIATCFMLAAQSFVFSARVVEAVHPSQHTGPELRRLLDGYLLPAAGPR